MRLVFSYIIYFLVTIGISSAQSSTSFSTLLSNDDPEIHFISTIGDVFVSSPVANNQILSQGYIQYEINYAVTIKEVNASKFIVHPNPSNGKIYISAKKSINTAIDVNKIEILDYRGRLIYQMEGEDSFSNLIIDLSNIDNGLYMIYIYLNNSIEVLKVVKN